MKINKIIAMALFVLMAISLTPFVVSADANELEVNTVYSASTPTFGDANQEASNPEHDDEDNYVINVTKTISLTNNGTGGDVKIDSISFSNNTLMILVIILFLRFEKDSFSFTSFSFSSL